MGRLTNSLQPPELPKSTNTWTTEHTQVLLKHMKNVQTSLNKINQFK